MWSGEEQLAGHLRGKALQEWNLISTDPPTSQPPVNSQGEWTQVVVSRILDMQETSGSRLSKETGEAVPASLWPR